MPDCLRVLYSFNYTFVAPEKNTIAIGKLQATIVFAIILTSSCNTVEYTPQAYVASDLDLFFSNFSPSQVGERPVLYSIDGGPLPLHPFMELVRYFTF